MFKKNVEYSKKDIYRILKVPVEKQRGAWDTGYREYNGDIFIFANVGVAGRTGHDYDNHWDGDDFIWYGKTGSHIDQPLIKKIMSKRGKEFVFVRNDDRQPFSFQGKATIKLYENTSPVRITWSFEKPRLLSLKDSWLILLKNAKILCDTGEVFVSPRHFHKYRIIQVTKDFVKIRRLSIESQTEMNLTYDVFEGAILRINDNYGVVERKYLYAIVLIETAIVRLLPMLDWDNDLKNIIVVDTGELDQSELANVEEAKDDIDFKIITRTLRVRRGQNKLRENLFYLYQGKCCLTKFGIKDLLHACHIIPHAHSGINATTNAFLFRADVHDLFDSNLIGIDPKTLTVATTKILKDTEYKSLHGAKIQDRVDGIKPNRDALNYRWDIFNSSK